MAAPAVTKPAAGGGQKPAPAQPFRVGVYDTDTPDIQVTLAATAAPQKLGTFKISPNGWLSRIDCDFQLVITTASTFVGDQPWSGIQKVTFKDVGNREIFGPLTGYEWFTVCKWGGYFANPADPRNPASQYIATTLTVNMQLFIPLEVVLRDTLGEIENKSSSSSYTLEIYIDSIANTATSATAISWTMYGSLLGYTEPEATDAMGRPLSQSPPAAGTVQYWTSEIYNSPAGNIRYNQVNGIGYPIRNLAYVAYDAASTYPLGRAVAWTWGGPVPPVAGANYEWPNPLTLAFGKVQLFQRYTWQWGRLMALWYSMNGVSTGDANGSLENGVFVHPFTRDFDSGAGQETRNSYLITKAGNVLQISGSAYLALNIHVLTNYVVPPGNDASKLRAR